MKCPSCQNLVPEKAKFCMECGCPMQQMERTPDLSPIDSERKQVTILFSDLSGYTAMTERLDPEEVKGIMSLIFRELTRIIKNYEGFIEKFIGDAVMAVFGVPKAHEDDPIRAIRAAMEMKAVVKEISPQFEGKIGRSLNIHTGINTGLVVTGEVDVEKGTHGLTGDAINLASRLESIAKAGEIIVGPNTYSQALNFFEFEVLAPVMVKGKQKPVNPYKLKSAKKESYKTHRILGLQAVLTGRDKEMAILTEAVERLKQGRGSIISITGDAGTGKSRLKKELKDSLDLNETQWREGHAYSYTQNMPYYPLINLLIHAFQIDEGDSPEGIRSKLKTGIAYLLGEDYRHTPYIGSLFALSYPEAEDVSPEYWKNKLGESIQVILSALMEKGPIVICLEDLHWADPSFIELFKRLVLNSYQKALFIFTYRSHFKLFEDDLPEDIKSHYQDIFLKDLDILDAQAMLKSLLGIQLMPAELKEIIRQKAEGNPFYIEEMINSLIDNEILTRDKDSWKLNRKITDSDIPATINGVLSARVDRLGKQFKRVLQEASVVGRVFLYEIIERITDIDGDIDQTLSGLENLDLIRTQTLEPELEYIFKHALTQEVVYNGLLISERKVIHERIGLVIEKLFHGRLPEFYETLALHFKRGQSVIKAVEYLTKSGQKSYSRYALEESHQYYKEAYELLSEKDERSVEEDHAIIDLLIKWAKPLHFRGAYTKLCKLFYKYEYVATALDDKEKLGMFYNWLGWALRQRNNISDSNKYLLQALKIGEDLNDNKIICLACSWISLNYAELGQFESGIEIAKRAQKISSLLTSDFLFRWALWGLAFNYYFKGECNEVLKVGYILKERGEIRSDIRALVSGNIVLGLSHSAIGDSFLAIEFFQKAIEKSIDPYLSALAKLFLGLNYANIRQLKEAEETLEDVMKFSERFGVETLKAPAELLKATVLLIKGDLNQGVEITKRLISLFLKNDNKYRYAFANYILGKVYLDIVQREQPTSFAFLTRNFGFLLKNIFYARKNARDHFLEAIEVSEQNGSMGVLGQSYFGLGLLYKAVGKIERAKENLTKAKNIFRKFEANVYLRQVEEVLISIK